MFRALYRRDHLDQVLATFGLILFFNEMVRIIWGDTALYSAVPDFLAGRVDPPAGPQLSALSPRDHRASGWRSALLLYLLVMRTRLGMLIRAGGVEPDMVGGARHRYRAALHAAVFGLGAMLAALPGLLAGPVFSVTVGDGRRRADPRDRGHRHRRHRLDPRRLHRGAPDRRRRYDGPRLPAPVLAARAWRSRRPTMPGRRSPRC